MLRIDTFVTYTRRRFDRHHGQQPYRTSRSFPQTPLLGFIIITTINHGVIQLNTFIISIIDNDSNTHIIIMIMIILIMIVIVIVI